VHEERGIRELRAYYFHNTVYDEIFTAASMRRDTTVSTAELLRRYDDRWKLLVVGDAAMHPAELLDPHGNIDPRRTAPTPSIVWLQQLVTHFERAAWLNPDEPKLWDTRTP
jgi:uncharacterized protein with von Willebrand factor type A (vWA) domain